MGRFTDEDYERFQREEDAEYREEARRDAIEDRRCDEDEEEGGEE